MWVLQCQTIEVRLSRASFTPSAMTTGLAATVVTRRSPSTQSAASRLLVGLRVATGGRLGCANLGEYACEPLRILLFVRRNRVVQGDRFFPQQAVMYRGKSRQQTGPRRCLMACSNNPRCPRRLASAP